MRWRLRFSEVGASVLPEVVMSVMARIYGAGTTVRPGSPKPKLGEGPTHPENSPFKNGASGRAHPRVLITVPKRG
ncbi:hypothetical protein Shyd_70380 [Streptomyces hydrogenans]|uniref:Uncharacterized protein n=1 Tax=Streptomyces hydrogenans TaxID=1873719 RepID=A0ABQ3PKX4_9ACTN|nr:hypothetical protein Shyd_70380 [Streptomyces hydrogenans]